MADQGILLQLCYKCYNSAISADMLSFRHTSKQFAVVSNAIPSRLFLSEFLSLARGYEATAGDDLRSCLRGYGHRGHDVYSDDEVSEIHISISTGQ